jgi:hypothetical protein
MSDELLSSHLAPRADQPSQWRWRLQGNGSPFVFAARGRSRVSLTGRFETGAYRCLPAQLGNSGYSRVYPGLHLFDDEADPSGGPQRPGSGFHW